MQPESQVQSIICDAPSRAGPTKLAGLAKRTQPRWVGVDAQDLRDNIASIERALMVERSCWQSAARRGDLAGVRGHRAGIVRLEAKLRDRRERLGEVLAHEVPRAMAAE